MDYAILEWEHDEVKKKAFIENLAPIVLFTYNRLEHTKQTIEALQNNVYAKQSELFICSDAPKNEQAKEKVSAVRSYIRGIQGFKKITIIERDANWGLAKNIIDGVTNIVNKYGKIIVLEDDILTSKYFLKFMNDALEFYKDEQRVMQISGYLYPIEKDNLPETFFLAHGFCWGWATWKESWKFFERNPQKFIKEFNKDDINKFNFNNTTGHWQQVIDNYNGELYTWAVFFGVAIFRNKGLTLCSKKGMAKNIGFDGSGEHCGVSEVHNVDISNSEIEEFTTCITESNLARNRVEKYFLALQPTLHERVINKFKRIIKGCILKV